MKKPLLLAGLLLVVLALLMLPPSSTPLSAQSGCCKIRSDPNGQWRKALDLTYEQCRQRKKEIDGGGDLFAGKGHVWWDKDCS